MRHELNLTNYSFEKATEGEKRELAKFNIGAEEFDKTTFAYDPSPDAVNDPEKELVKGSNYVIHVTWIKEDVWNPRFKGIRFDADQRALFLVHQTIGGSGRIESLEMEYALEGDAALVAMANGLPGSERLRRRVRENLESLATPREIALKLYSDAKTMLTGKAPTRGSRFAALELLRSALKLDPDDQTGLVRPLLAVLEGREISASEMSVEFRKSQQTAERRLETGIPQAVDRTPLPVFRIRLLSAKEPARGAGLFTGHNDYQQTDEKIARNVEKALAGPGKEPIVVLITEGRKAAKGFVRHLLEMIFWVFTFGFLRGKKAPAGKYLVAGEPEKAFATPEAQKEYLAGRIKSIFGKVDPEKADLSRLLIAYEPAWAIEKEPATHDYIRQAALGIQGALKGLFKEKGAGIPVLYGGGVTQPEAAVRGPPERPVARIATSKRERNQGPFVRNDEHGETDQGDGGDCPKDRSASSDSRAESQAESGPASPSISPDPYEDERPHSLGSPEGMAGAAWEIPAPDFKGKPGAAVHSQTETAVSPLSVVGPDRSAGQSPSL